MENSTENFDREMAKDLAMSDIGLTEEEAEQATIYIYYIRQLLARVGLKQVGWLVGDLTRV